MSAIEKLVADPVTSLKATGHERIHLREAITLLAIVVVAAVLRFYRLETVPPGLMFDVGANVVDAAAIADGERPVFLTGNLGREPLFHYLVAISFAMLGVSLTSFRLVPALLGVVTVVSTYLLTRELVGRRAALFAAALLAGSYWHVALSRIGFRAIATPLCGSLAFWLLWSGWRTARIGRFALGGVFLGLGLYTYIPARVYPVLALLLGLAWLGRPPWRKPGEFRRVGLGLAIAAVLAAIVAAPIARYFWHHPDDFFGRVQSISIQADATRSTAAFIVDSALKTLGLFVVAGDANPHHNLPGRPAFDPLTAPFFLLGVAVAIRRICNPRLAFLSIWLVALLLPGALSREAPHFLRTAGAIPATYALAGLGAARLVWYLDRIVAARSLGPTYRHLPVAIVVALTTAGVALTSIDYFVRWAPSQAAYRASAGDALDAAEILLHTADDGERLLGIRTYHGQSAELMVLGGAARARAFDATRTLVIPEAADRPVWYAFVVGRPQATINEERLSPLLQQGQVVARSADPGGAEAVRLLRLDRASWLLLRPDRALPAVIGDAIEVLGYDLPRRARPGDTVVLAVHWRVVGMLTPGRSWQFFAHLAHQGRAWASDYHEGFEPGQWRYGDRVVSWFELRIPSDLPVGTYPIEFGFFERSTGERLPIVDGQQKPIGDVLLLGPIRVAEPQSRPPRPTTPVSVALGDAIRLVGYDPVPTTARPGELLDVRLYWQAVHTLPVDYTVFVHLIDPNGKLVAQQDSQPLGGALPTSLWVPEEVVRDEYQVVLPANASPGRYTLLVGMYRLDTGQRLPIRGEDGKAVGDTLPLSTVEVVAR